MPIGGLTSINLPVHLTIENLKNIMNDLQNQLSTLKVGTKGFKDVQNIIGSIGREIDKLQIQTSKPFINLSQFNQTERTVGKIEDSLEKVLMTMGRIKFSDLNLNPSQTAELQQFEKQINQIQNSIKQVKETAKLEFLATDAGKAWLGIDPTAINLSLNDITKSINKAVRDLASAIDKAKQKVQEYENVLAEKLKLLDFSTKINKASTLGDTRKVFGAAYEQFFTSDDRFKKGGRRALEDWLINELDIDPQKVRDAVAKKASAVLEELKNGELNTLISNKINSLSTQGAKMKKDDPYKEVTVLEDKLKALTPVLEEIGLKNRDVSSSTEKFEGDIKNVNAALLEWKERLTNAAREHENLSKTCGAMNSLLHSLRDALARSNTEFLRMEQTTRNFNAIKMAITNFMGFTQVLNLTKRAIRAALNHIRELDTVMNGISIVTDMTTADLWLLIDAYSEMAQRFGTTIKGAYEVSLIYYQQGLQTNDVLTLTNETLKLAKVSGLDYAQTTDYMTTALRGFKMEMSDASVVVDVYSNLAAHTAVTLEELAVAMSKTASSLESVGSTFQESSAMISTMVAVTRESATNIGSALKSIAARYGEMKQDPATLFDAEGEALSFNKVDTALLSVGISLKDTNGQFRDFTDVIIELSDKWNTLESTQLRYIATLFAGNRQQSRFLALVSNGDLLKSNLNYALNSEDTGTLQALKTLDSIESKTNLVKVAYQQLYTTIGVEDAWKGFLDGAKNVMDTLNHLPKLFNKVPLMAIGLVTDFVVVIKEVGFRLLGGVTGIWNKILPEDMPDKMKVIAEETARIFSDTLKNKLNEENVGEQIANLTVNLALTAQLDLNKPAGNIKKIELTAEPAQVLVNLQVATDINTSIDFEALKAKIADLARAAGIGEITTSIKIVDDVVSIDESIPTKIQSALNSIDFTAPEGLTQFLQAIADIKNSLTEEQATLFLNAFSCGDNVIKGLLLGLASPEAAIALASESGEKVIQALKDGLGVHSPSVPAMEASGLVINGLLIGWESNIEEIIQKALNSGKDIILALQEGLVFDKDGFETFKLGFLSELNKLGDSISPAVKSELQSVFANLTFEDFMSGKASSLAYAIVELFLKNFMNAGLTKVPSLATLYESNAIAEIESGRKKIGEDMLTDEQRATYQSSKAEIHQSYKSRVEPLEKELNEIEPRILALEEKAESIRQLRIDNYSNDSTRQLYYKNIDAKNLLSEQEAAEYAALQKRAFNLQGDIHTEGVIAGRRQRELESQTDAFRYENREQLARYDQQALYVPLNAQHARERAEKGPQYESTAEIAVTSLKTRAIDRENNEERRMSYEMDYDFKRYEREQAIQERNDMQARENAWNIVEANNRRQELPILQSSQTPLEIRQSRFPQNELPVEKALPTPIISEDLLKANQDYLVEVIKEKIAALLDLKAAQEAVKNTDPNDKEALANAKEARKVAVQEAQEVNPEKHILWNTNVDSLIASALTELAKLTGTTNEAAQAQENLLNQAELAGSAVKQNASDSTLEVEKLKETSSNVPTTPSEPQLLKFNLDNIEGPLQEVPVNANVEPALVAEDTNAAVELAEGQIDAIDLMTKVDNALAAVDKFKNSYTYDAGDNQYYSNNTGIAQGVALSESEYNNQLSILLENLRQAQSEFAGVLAAAAGIPPVTEEVKTGVLGVGDAAAEAGQKAQDSMNLATPQQLRAAIEDLINQLVRIGAISEDDGAKFKASLASATPEELATKFEQLNNILRNVGDTATDTGSRLAKINFSTIGSAIRMLASISGMSQQAKGGIMALGSAITLVFTLIQVFHKQSQRMAMSNPWIAIATGVVGLINGISLLYESSEERLERLTKEAEEFSNKAKLAKANVRDLETSKTKLEELTKTRYDSEEAAEDYQAAVDDLAEKFPQLIEAFDSTGNAIIDETRLTNALTDARRESAEAALKAAKAEKKASEEKVKKAQQEAVEAITLINFDSAAGLEDNVKAAPFLYGKDKNNGLYGFNDLGISTEASSAFFSDTNARSYFNEIWNNVQNGQIYNGSEDVWEKLLAGFVDTNGEVNIKGLLSYIENSSNKITLSYEGVLAKNYLQQVYGHSSTDVDRSTLRKDDTEEWKEWNDLLNSEETDIDILKYLLDQLSNAVSENNEEGILKYLNLLGEFIEAIPKGSWILNLYGEQLQDYTSAVNSKIGNLLSLKKLDDAALRTVISAELDNTKYFNNSEKGMGKSSALKGLVTSNLAQDAEGSDQTATEYIETQQTQARLLAINDAWDKLGTQYTNEGINYQERFDKMMADSKHYSWEDIARELGLSVNDALYIELQLKFETTSEEIKTAITLGLNNRNPSTNINTLKDYIEKENEAFTEIDRMYFMRVADLVEVLEKRGQFGAAGTFVNYATELDEELDLLDEGTRNIILDSIEKNGITTKEGLAKVRADAEAAGASKDVLNKLDDLAEITTSNITLAIETLTSDLTENWSKSTKNIKKLTSGVEFTEIPEILAEAEKMSFELSQSDFMQNGNTLVLTAEKAIEYWEAYIDYNQSLADALQGQYDAATTLLGSVTTSNGSVGFRLNSLTQAVNTNEGYDTIASIMGDRMSNYLTEDHQIDPTKLVQLRNDLMEILTSDAEKLQEYELTLGFAKGALVKSVLWSQGDFSSLKDVYKNIEEHLNKTDKELTVFIKSRLAALVAGTELLTDEEYKQPDIKNAIELIRSSTSTFISDLLQKDLKTLYAKDYLATGMSEDEIAGIINDYKGYTALEFAKNISDLAATAGQTLSEQNNAFVQAFEKQSAMKSSEGLKNLSFAGTNMYASTKDLQSFADTYNLKLSDITQEGIGTYNEILNQWVIDYTKIEDFPVPEDLRATINDSIRTFFEDLGKLISDGIKGALTDTQRAQLEQYAKEQFGIASLGFEKVNGGWELTLDSSARLLNAMQEADASVDQRNELVIALYTKMILHGADSIKDLSFIDDSHFSATGDELALLAKEYNLDLQQLIQDGLIYYDETLQEFIVNWFNIDDLKSDFEGIKNFNEIVQDSTNEFYDKYAELINKGIEGSLSNTEFANLKDLALKIGMDPESLSYSKTAEGLKLSNDSAKELYNTVSHIRELQDDTTFDKLKESLIGSKDELRSVQTSLNYTQDLTRELYGAEMIEAGITKDVDNNRNKKVAFFEEMNGNVDLYNRKRIDRTDLGEGWYSTLETATLESRNFKSDVPWVMNITPIPPDAKDVKDMLSQEKLDKYVQDLIDRAKLDPKADLDVNMNAILAADRDIENGGKGLIVNLRMAEEVTDSMVEEESQRAEILHEISDVYEGIKDGDTYDPTKINLYKEELSLVLQIRNERSTTEDDSFKFMENNIPSGQNNPLNYFENWATAYEKMRESIKGGKGKKGYMAYEDFYNIITEMGEIAKLSGEAVHLGKATVEDAQTAADLITKAAGALEITSDGKLKVNLKNIGVDFSTGAKLMNEDVDTGINALADSLIEMLDGMISLLETIVAMEGLQDLDIEGDGIDIGDIMTIRYDKNNKMTSAKYTKVYDDWRKDMVAKFTDYIDKGGATGTSDYIDLGKAMEGIKFRYDGGSKTFADILTMKAATLAGMSDDFKTAYTAFLDGMIQASLSDDFDLDNIYDSIKTVLANSGIENLTIDMGEKTFHIGGGTIAVIDWSDQDMKNAVTEALDVWEKAHDGFFKGLPKDADIRDKVAKIQKELSDPDSKLTFEERLELLNIVNLATGDTLLKEVKVKGKKNQFEGTYKGKKLGPASKEVIEEKIKEAMKLEAAGLDFNFEKVGDDIEVTGYKEIGGTTIKLVDVDGLKEYEVLDKRFKTLEEAVAYAVSQGYGDLDMDGFIYESEGNIVLARYDALLGITYAIDQTTGYLIYKGKPFKNKQDMLDYIQKVEPLLNDKKWKSEEKDGLEIIKNGTATITRNLETGELTYTDGGATFKNAEDFGNYIYFKKLAESQKGGSITIGEDGEGNELHFTYMNQQVELTVDADGNLKYKVSFGAESGLGQKGYFTADTMSELKAGLAGLALLQGSTITLDDVNNSGGTIAFTLDDGTAINVSYNAEGKVTVDSKASQELKDKTQKAFEQGLTTLAVDASSATTTIDASLTAPTVTLPETITYPDEVKVTISKVKLELGDDFTIDVESIAEAIRKALLDALDNKPVTPTVLPTPPTPTGGNGDGGSNIASIFSGAITAIKEKISSLSIDATATKILDKLSSLNADSSTTTIQKKLTALNADAPTRTIQNKLTALNVNTAATLILNKLNLISGATAASNILTAINNISLDTLTTAIGKVNTAINNLNNSSISPTITPTIKPTISGTNANANAKITVSAATLAKGNVALARGTKTLMGELGPELVVSNGRYFVVGQNGAEFVDLANDAIVFNHKLTARLIGSGGISSRGTPFTNEINAISYAKGNISGPAQANPTLRITSTSPQGVDHGINSFNWAAFKISIPTSTSTSTTSYVGKAKDVAQVKGTGPALASAQAALTALKQLRAMWKSLKDTNMKDLASLGGSGGGGGGGSGSKDKDNVNKAFIKELERWYNWLQEIALLEEKINMEEALRNKLASDNYKNGKAYYLSQRRSLDNLLKELAVTEDLLLSQKAYFNSRVEFLNSKNNPFSSLYKIDEETGQLQYKDGKLAKLSELSGTDAYGDPYKTAQEQYTYITDTLKIDKKWLEYDASGQKIEQTDNDNYYVEVVEAFWDKMEADKEEMLSLHDSIDEYLSKLLKLQLDENEILQDMQDNLMDVETAIYDALVETKQRAIDKLSDLKDAYSDASSKMISGLSDTLNKEKDKLQKNEEDAELLRLRRRLALLLRSGGSASEISSLLAEIRSKSLDAYYNEQLRLIDLLLDAADKQIERLDTLIDIQTRTLEYQQLNGLLWNEVYAQMKKSPTEIANFLKKNTEDFWGKSTLAKSETADDWLFKASLWVEFRNDLAKTGKDRDGVAKVIQTLATKNSSTKSADDFAASLSTVYGNTYKYLTKSVKDSIKKAFETEYTASGDYIQAVNKALGKANLLTETLMSGKKYVAVKGKSGAWELKESTSKNATTGNAALKTVKQNNAWIDREAEYKAKYGNSWNTLSSAQKTTIANAVKTQATASKNDKTKADNAVTKALAAPGTLYTATERNKKQFKVETKKGVSSIKLVKVGAKGATTYDEAYKTMQANNARTKAWQNYEASVLKSKYGATYTNLSSDRKETIKKLYLAAYNKEKTASKKATAGADAALKGQGAFLGTAGQLAQSGGAKDTYGWTYTKNATTGKYEAKKIAKKDAGTKTLTNYAKALKAAQRRNDWEAFIAPYSATWNTLLTGDLITSLKSIYDKAWNDAKSKPAEAASKAVKNSKVFKDNFVDKVWAVKQDTKTKTWSVVKARKSTKTPTTKHKATLVAKSNNNAYKQYLSKLAAAKKKGTTAPAAPKYNTTYQYDIGGMVESTGMALLHAKEAVLTSQLTDILRNDILGNNKGSLVNLLLDFKKAYNNIGNPGAQMEPAIIILNASVNMNVEKIANDYDARRAGEQALTEMLKIARKTGATSTLRR